MTTQLQNGTVNGTTVSGEITIQGSQIAGILIKENIGGAYIDGTTTLKDFSTSINSSISSLGSTVADKVSTSTYTQGMLAVEEKIENADTEIMRKVTANQGDISALKGQTTGISYDNGSQTTTVGGVGFNAGALTGVTSINVGDNNSKFNINENGELQVEKKITISDGNSSGYLNLDKFNSINKLMKVTGGVDSTVVYDTNDKPVITAGNGSTIGGVGFNNGAVTNVKSINGTSDKFSIDEDGKLRAANGKFKVNTDGTLTAKSGSKIGDITIENGQLVAPLSGATDGKVRVNVTDLAADHELVNDANLGNERLNSRINSLETSNDTLTAKTRGIERVLDNSGRGIGTSIENKLDVYEDGTVIINYGDAQQVTIDSKGIKVGQNSSRMNDITGFATSKNLYVGTTDADNPTEANSKFYVKGDDGSVKAADGKFTVEADGAVSAAGKMQSKTLSAGTTGNEFTVDENGNVFAAGNVTANQAGFNNLAVTNGMTVGSVAGNYVHMKDGSIIATGSVTANQAGFNDLAVTNGLTVGSATGDFVNVLNGNVTATGKMKSKTLSAGTNGDEFTVDENGNVVAKGTVSAANGKFTVDADGAVKAADGKFKVETDGTVKVGTDKFTVDGTTGNTTVGGTLNVTGDTTLGNATVGGTLGVTGNATVGGTLNVTGDTTLGGNMDVTGNATVGGTLNSKGNFSVGTNNEFTVDATNGNVVSKGSLTSSSATIGTVGITNTGVITGVSSLTTDALIVNGALNINGDITGKNISGDSLAVTGNGTIGGSLSVTGAITGATINGATITTDSFNGATIKSNKFNGVTLDNNGNISGQDINASGNINANGTINGATITNNSFNGVTMTSGNVTGATITGTTITDGAGASMNAGTVKGTTITDGNGFTATGGNVSATDVTATGTVKGTTVTDGVAKMNGGKVTAQNGLEVDANNYLNSTGLKASNIDASKATIGKLKIEGSQITSTEADGTVGLAGVTVNNAGALNNVTSIDGVAVSGSAASGLTVGAGATAVTIGGNSMALSSTNFGVDNDGDVTGQSFTAGNSYLKDGELKLNDANIWTTAEGIKAEKATIGANTLDSTGFSTTGTLDVAGKATFGSNAANSTTIEQGAVSVTQNGKTTTIKGGEIETDKLTVNDIVLKNSMKDGAGNTITISGTDGSLSVASSAFAVDKDGQLKNKITGSEGGYTYETNLETSKSGINANYTNAVNGNNNLLAIDKDGVALGVTDSTNHKLGGFAANKDNASLSYGANNSIVVDANTIKSALGSDVSTTLTNNGADQSIVNKVTDNATSTIKSDSIVNKVGSAKRSLKADEIVDEAAGMTVKTNADGTLFTNGTNSTLINGSKLTSTNGTATGVLDGSNLTLTDGAKNTELTAGGASFTGAAGSSSKAGTTTTIDGGTITTDTLKVERIELGETLIDTDGNATNPTFGSKLSMDKDGNFSAAGGNFTVTGTNDTEGNIGAITNSVGGTKFSTNKTGAGMSFNNNPTEPSSGITSNVSVGNNKANVSAGAGSIDVTNESITSKVGTDASSTIAADKIVDKVGNNSVTTDANGTTFDNGTNKTNINGGTITTGKLVTDELVITGNGDAAGDGSGSLAFGGNGTIKSDVRKDGSTKNTQFTTDIDGVTTKVTDGTNTTTNEVAATGNTNTVTNGTATSKNTQTATSIGGVITNGTVKIAQTLDGENGNITNEVTDKDGNSSKLVQNGTGLEYTDSAKADNATRINSSDVSIGSATDDSKRINLSDLGQIDDLDSELSARDEFKNNSTAVGGINAEAAARREEVARLDNRIDDVNNRVDKVGAMAAAIASLKSIGYDPQAPSEFSVGLGQYKGETGVALGFFHYPNKNFMINVSLSTAGGETMGGIGATWRFGHKSPQKLLNEQREAQARKELAAAEKYKAAAQLAKEAQERAEYAAKLARQAQVSADNAKAAADATQSKHFNK